MNKLTFTLIFVISTFCVNAQIINFPDANFKAKLLEAASENYIAKNASEQPIKIDENNNGEIEVIETENVFYLDVNNQDAVTGITSTTTAISSLVGIEYFVNLTHLNVNYNNVSSLNLNTLINLTNLNCSNNLLTTFTIANPLALIQLNYSVNQISNLNVNQFLNLEYLNCSSNQIENLDLSNLTSLFNLDCSANLLTTLNLNNLNNLYSLDCGGNQLTTLSLSNLTNLSYLVCINNLLTSLDLTSNIPLQQIYCQNNLLTSLVLPNNPITDPTQPSILDCSNNQLTNLTVTKISSVSCMNNLLTTINFLYPQVINRLRCNNNNFTSLDLSSLTKNTIGHVDISNNPNLTYLNIKNGKHNLYSNSIHLLGLFFNDCPNLQYICIDDISNEITYIQSKIDEYGYTNCQANSYCSFVPGGLYYTIHGQQKFDNENDGCDSNDFALPNFKYSITNGTTVGTMISNSTGTYSIPVQAGSYTITPIIENPSYFTVSPTNVVVNFPAQASPFTQDFCVVANGNHSDVEISLIPINPARPGFDANYKIIYKNKGNQIENGSVNLQFDDAILDVVSTNPAFTTQTTNNLSFNYSNLIPLETREILVILNVNSPMETPAVNGGDILNFLATNTITNADEMLSDNSFVLNQTVVNSYDPNDKTCLQGNYVSPDKIGEFVHYVIRFENTGTFPAENIVVKDMIDTDKFDVSSLIPLNASHNYVTRITDNKVEFIFENINLPFDDGNNDGYISFKIKTIPSLIVGNTFSNTANIYFDYNFPIVTNTATTTIAALNNPSFEFATYFSLYPNPATHELNINLKSAIEINSIQIYNTIGQLVSVQTGNTLKVDVSHLKTGNYFIKINTNEGFSTSQFIKK